MTMLDPINRSARDASLFGQGSLCHILVKPVLEQALSQFDQ